jgi:phosphotransferase system  glucose/maltose/N-acetylglucosamine-specific IIC component
MNAQAGYLLYNDCKAYPQRIISVYLVYIVSLLILFANFFIVSYMTEGKKEKKDKRANLKKTE